MIVSNFDHLKLLVFLFKTLITSTKDEQNEQAYRHKNTSWLSRYVYLQYRSSMSRTNANAARNQRQFATLSTTSALAQTKHKNPSSICTIRINGTKVQMTLAAVIPETRNISCRLKANFLNERVYVFVAACQRIRQIGISFLLKPLKFLSNYAIYVQWTWFKARLFKLPARERLYRPCTQACVSSADKHTRCVIPHRTSQMRTSGLFLKLHAHRRSRVVVAACSIAESRSDNLITHSIRLLIWIVHFLLLHCLH